ncbi:hypothetical protein PYCCODRAFT_1423044 [Trametes coccinea BRFM310]|uniref:Uncharacterized protein n=1 Tax=Trametes coccinea (strain BRFM310) TaxID=1353009 RepID=A0A1Y2IZZ8_TRAC3|nr:hypothetical protein PYCCODRAFT_1423044 [Trametes coccinea BRFM310]
MPSHDLNGNHQDPGNLPMREHLNVQEVRFTAMQGDATSSSWVTASITLYEVRNSDAGPNTAYWALGIYPHGGSHRAQMVYLTGDDWIIKWEEMIHFVMFVCTSGESAQTTRYCLIIDAHSEYLKLLYMCSNIRIPSTTIAPALDDYKRSAPFYGKQPSNGFVAWRCIGEMNCPRHGKNGETILKRTPGPREIIHRTHPRTIWEEIFHIQILRMNWTFASAIPFVSARKQD